jgi:hypothetical protein
MKRLSVMLSVALIVLFHSVQAQSKKELEQSLARVTTSQDSLQKLYTGLSAKYDSVRKVCLAYDNMAETIREKLIRYDYKPENIGKIIDSLKTNNDSVLAKGVAKLSALKDSVTSLRNLSDSLRSEVSQLAFVVNKYVNNGTLPATVKDFSGSWDLNLKWLETTNDSSICGIVLKPIPAGDNTIRKIHFIDFETAQVHFSQGDSIKCFYVVNSFAADKPYSINLTRENKLNLSLSVNPFDGDLYISYRKDKGYYYGFMRKE